MAGGYYTALSGMRTRQDALDRLASDIANSSTSGYKTERAGTEEAQRPSFGATLQSAVDVANGHSRLDLRPGAFASTGRNLDVAIAGKGYFVVETPQGDRYTRNGHLIRRPDGVLATDESNPILGEGGPITIGEGEVQVDPDGTIRAGRTIAGKLRIVEFDEGTELARDSGAIFRTAGTPKDVVGATVTAGNLEQSNVSIVERIAELTDVSRSYETLLRSVSILMNDVDKTAIGELGRK
jgi:flagellar basal body rod protein FlgG